MKSSRSKSTYRIKSSRQRNRKKTSVANIYEGSNRETAEFPDGLRPLSAPKVGGKRRMAPINRKKARA